MHFNHRRLKTSMMKKEIFTVEKNIPLSKDIFSLSLAGDTSAITVPGQFVNIKIDGFFLRRPLSVCDAEKNRLTVVYRVAGAGTQRLSSMGESETLELLTGLGNGFDLSRSGSRPLLIGGGLGFTPMFFLARKLLEEGKKPVVLLGASRKEELVWADRFREIGAELIVTTEDGSAGTKGFVTDAMPGIRYTYFYACGPEAMFNAVNAAASSDGEFSFEQRMGCGFGACMGCTCETVAGPKRICKDGPVLKRGEIRWPI